MQRSLSHPSLARSASEFTEHWVPPNDSDMSSPEGTPNVRRTNRVLVCIEKLENYDRIARSNTTIIRK